jgi:hypothetical protein
MSNADLLVSSSLCGVIHFFAFAFVEAPFFLQITHLLVCYTAMQYHCVPHPHLKWTNRAMTIITFFVDYHYSRGVWSFQAMLWISLGSYLWSKWFEQDGLYAFAQWLMTVNHVSMYVWFNTLGNFNKIRV